MSGIRVCAAKKWIDGAALVKARMTCYHDCPLVLLCEDERLVRGLHGAALCIKTPFNQWNVRLARGNVYKYFYQRCFDSLLLSQTFILLSKSI
jgi:hypothetical protein